MKKVSVMCIIDKFINMIYKNSHMMIEHTCNFVYKILHIHETRTKVVIFKYQIIYS